MIIWKPDPLAGYLVKFGNVVLEAVWAIDDVDVTLKKAFCSIWKTHSPFKVKIFVWRCFLNRILMKDQLRRRGILSSPHDLPCALCFQVEEDLCHLFSNCRVVVIIWKKVVDWIGIDWMNVVLVWISFSSWVSVEKFKKFKKRKEGIAWMEVVWSLSNIRNDILFNDVHYIVSDLL